MPVWRRIRPEIPEPSGDLTAPGYDESELIGRGRFGVVYRARAQRSGQLAVVKVFSVPFTDATVRGAFHNELQRASRLAGHPNLVAVLDWGTTDSDAPYVAMEYCSRGSLHQRLVSRGPLPVAEVLDIGVRLAAVLAFVHRHGLLHSDVSPQNVLIRSDGEPALADLGIAPLLSQTAERADPRTLAYTAPEVLQGQALTPASDAYSLGATLYHLLAGRPPYPTDDTGVAGLLLRILRGEQPQLARADVAPPVRALILKAMSALPADRYPDAATLTTALQRLQLDLGLSTTEPATTTAPATTPEPTTERALSRGRPGAHRADATTRDQPIAERPTSDLRIRDDLSTPPPEQYNTTSADRDLVLDEWPQHTRPPRWPIAATTVILVLVALVAPIFFLTSNDERNVAPTGPPGVPTGAPETTPPASLSSSASATSTPSANMTPKPDRATGPSGQPMPVGDLPGWRQVFTEDFVKDADLGSFTESAYQDTWKVYEDGTTDSSGSGVFFPSKVLSVDNSLLNVHVHTENGSHIGAAVVPILPGIANGLLYGRFTVRIRADPVPGYRVATVLWPDSERWPDDGHIEFPAGDLDEDIHAWVEYAQPSGGGEGVHTSATFPEWHTATTEWSPGQAKFILDGRVVGAITTKVPETPLHLVIQTETCFDSCQPSRSGNVQVDWVAIYARA